MLLFVGALNAIHVAMLSGECVCSIRCRTLSSDRGYMWESVGKKFASPAESAENVQRPREEKENANSGTFSFRCCLGKTRRNPRGLN